MFSYSHTVQYYETDKMGVTHHSNYIRFMEEARIAFMQSIGWSYDKMESMEIVSPGGQCILQLQKTQHFR